MASPDDPAPTSRRDRHELLVTLLLVAATLGTSWSSYQAARWHGEQARETSLTSATRVEAARAAGLGEDQTGIDVATFIAWADADGRGEDDLADFYVERFRDEFKVAFDAWIATRPFQDADAPSTPFAMDQYQVEARNEATRLDGVAATSAAKIGEDIQRASNYVLTVVLYATALFFAGMSTKLSGRRPRTTALAVGYLVLGGTLAWIATFPVSIRI